jgi:alkaline phosphatase
MRTLKMLVVTAFLTLAVCAHAQQIFAHNDYVTPNPFFAAYDLHADYIESDVFLEGERPVVAHTRREIDPTKTLESLYLLPLREKIESHNGKVHEGNYRLTLMIDLKTDGVPTLAAIVKLLGNYTDLTSCQSLTICISGSYPPPPDWKNYPDFIKFDGRPGVNYTSEQLKRVHLISIGFGSYSSWKGEGEIPERDLAKIKSVIAAANELGKPFRFWAIPDQPNSWRKLSDAGVSIINTDKVAEASAFVRNKER